MKEKEKKGIHLSYRYSKIMVIDDEKKLLVAIQKYLIAKNFKTIVCSSGEEALSKLKNEKVDLLVVDILMSKMSGYELIIKLKEEAKTGHIPFIFLTAKGMTEDRIKGYNMGCRAYLGKPFDPEELIAIINNILSDRNNINNILNVRSEIQKLREEIFKSSKLKKTVKFTTREINILLAVSQGLSNKDIAHNLNISVRNVENYITRLLRKTSVSNRVKLANYKYLQKGGE